MTSVAIDTLKVAQKLQDCGFSRKQAAGAAEVLAETLADLPAFAPKDATAASLALIAGKLESMDQRIDKRLSALESGRGIAFEKMRGRSVG